MDTTRTATLATGAVLATTAMVFVHEKWVGASVSGGAVVSAADYTAGLTFSFVALCGNTAAALLRKQLGKVSDVKPAEQVGIATALQAVVALAYCLSHGIELGTVATSSAFMVPAIASSMLNALTKTLETVAFATTDVSLCAPFLAFDPVMQFALPALFAPALCATSGLGCVEAGASFPPYHPLAVGCIAAGAFLLSRVAAAPAAAAAKKKDDKSRLAQTTLPLGAWLILFNCCVYAVTSRLDKAAVQSAGKTVYYAYGRVIMATTCLAGARPSAASLRAFAKPKAAALVAAVCCAEAVYMLALYQAFAKISPVYVTAIKRGGGVLLSSFASMLFFGESLKGRGFPILSIVSGVVALCL